MSKIQITPVDLDVLRCVNFYDCLTIQQVMRIFGWSSYPTVSARLKRLVSYTVVDKQGNKKQIPVNVLAVKKLPHPKWGGTTRLYKVGPEGKRLLKAEGIEVPRFDMGRDPLFVSTHYWHIVYVNDFFITAHRYAKDAATVQILAEKHDLDIRRDRENFPYQVLRTDGVLDGVVPDGYLLLSVDGKTYSLTLELETGTHAPAAVEKKIENLVYFYEQGYSGIFGTSNVYTFVFVAMNGEDHRKSILKTAAQTLRSMGRENLSDLFAVTSAPIDEPTLFTDHVWYAPNDYHPFRLLD